VVLSTGWLNWCPSVSLVSIGGRLLTGWSNEYPVVRWVNMGGSLSTGWWVSVGGSLSTGLLKWKPVVGEWVWVEVYN
jgi:hypothetical protein